MNRHNVAYSPLYWLAALGAGGLSVVPFVYINFMLPHKGVPMATFDFIYPALMKGNLLSYIVAVSALLIILFSFLHLKLVWWNIRQFLAFRKTEAFNKLLTGNAEVTLMAIPLTLTMTVNVLFILGAVFVPGLWGVVEYLFPAALLAFALNGYFAIRIFMEYFLRLIINGDYNLDQNNNLSQMLSIFAFTMVAVGFAAPAAMSKTLWVETIGTIGAIFFSSAALLLILIKMTLGFQSMLKNGISDEAAPSLWIMIPILTLLGITSIRLIMGFEHNFHAEPGPEIFLVLTATIVSLQLMFGKLGYFVMRRIGYFRTYVRGEKRSVGSFALICPGVAGAVFGMFFLHFGLIHMGIIEKFSTVYLLLLAPIVTLHMLTVYYFFLLKSRFPFGASLPAPQTSA